MNVLQHKCSYPKLPHICLSLWPWRKFCRVRFLRFLLSFNSIQQAHRKLFYSILRFRTCRWSLRWRHNGRGSISNHQPHLCSLNRWFRRRPKKTLKLRVTGLCAGNSPGTGEFPAQMASNAENVSIWWRHHVSISVGGCFNARVIK